MGKGQVIVTGATGSIGFEAIKALARQGQPVIMACRNVKKGEEKKSLILKEQPDAILQIEQVDMASLRSVAAFCNRLKDNGMQLAGLFNNAGIMNRHYHLSEDGFEHTLAVNYLAPYYLTRTLLPLCQPNAHIVNMVSLTCRNAQLDEHLFEKGEQDFHQLRTYGSTKLALLLATLALAKRVGQDIHVNMADPGIVNSNMISLDRWFDPLANVFFRPFIKSPKKGAVPALNALATDERLRYFSGNRCHKVHKTFLNNPHTEWLWNETENILCEKGFAC